MFFELRWEVNIQTLWGTVTELGQVNGTSMCST